MISARGSGRSPFELLLSYFEGGSEDGEPTDRAAGAASDEAPRRHRDPRGDDAPTPRSRRSPRLADRTGASAPVGRRNPTEGAARGERAAPARAPGAPGRAAVRHARRGVGGDVGISLDGEAAAVRRGLVRRGSRHPEPPREPYARGALPRLSAAERFQGARGGVARTSSLRQVGHAGPDERVPDVQRCLCHRQV